MSFEWFDPHQMRSWAERMEDEIYYLKRDAQHEIEGLKRRLEYERGRADSQQKTISDIVSRLPWPLPPPIFIPADAVQGMKK